MASVSSVSKQLRRMQQAANENIGLRNKTDELHNDIETLGNSVDGIKKAFQMTSSKVPSLYQGSGATHEKRRNKLPIVSLANSMQECATRIHCEFDEIERLYPQTKGSVLSKTLDMCSNVQHTLATNQADYELGLEIQVVFYLFINIALLYKSDISQMLQFYLLNGISILLNLCMQYYD